MTVLSDQQQTRVVKASPSRALRYLPATALIIDLAIVAAVTTLATLGRERLGFFDTAADVTGSLAARRAGDGRRVGGRDRARRRLREAASSAPAPTSTSGSSTPPSLTARPARRRVLPRQLRAEPRLLPARLRPRRRRPCSLGRFGLRRALHSARRRGVLRHRVLIAGSPSHVDEVAGVLRREPWLGYQVVGCLTPAHDLSEETQLGVPVLGNSDDATSVVIESGADVIFFAGGALGSPTRCARWSGTSSTTTCRWSWHPTSPTSPASGSTSARSAGCR